MPDRRKPPIEPSSRSGSRHDGATMPSSGIPAASASRRTTMRLKSLRLRRAEVVDQEDQRRRSSPAQPQAFASRCASGGPSGRVRHDERGVAVWDWAVATGEFADAEHHARAQETRSRRSQDRRPQDAPSSSSKSPAATRRADSIRTTSAVPASARVKRRSAPASQVRPDRGTVSRSAHGQEEVICACDSLRSAGGVSSSSPCRIRSSGVARQAPARTSSRPAAWFSASTLSRGRLDRPDFFDLGTAGPWPEILRARIAILAPCARRVRVAADRIMGISVG